jgi:uncharacterized protein (DUF433 family)
MTVTDILREWPELEADDITQALGFAALSTEEQTILVESNEAA